jgi:death-on-curing protein
VIYLTAEEALRVAERVLGSAPPVRDLGLVESAVARPAATVFGRDAYPTLHLKAAALLHSLARSHPLVDGNKRLALGATIVFSGMNGWVLTMTNAEAYDLVIAVASGVLDEVEPIAALLERGTRAV